VKLTLFAGLTLFAVGYALFWISNQRRSSNSTTSEDPGTGIARPSWFQAAIGFVTNFFDTLGIGSFAPTASIFKLTRMVPDELIPGTMNVGHTLPVVVQAFVYISIVEVEPLTLCVMITTSVLGAWLGSGVVSRLPRRPIQFGIGMALIVAAALMTLSQLELLPVGGQSLGLDGALLIAAAVGNFVLGALNTIGVGIYGPSMIMIALMGMNPRAAFPIMMGSCAFLMPVASSRFVRGRKYSLRPAIGLTVGGLPAVLIAAFLVKSLPLNTLRWIVVAVALYSAVVMLASAWMERKRQAD